ncbi:MAG TPA: sigma-54 dependent transcriptional regulator [Gammaproteobacteria bacterium]
MDALVQFAPLLDMFVSRVREGVVLTDNLGTILYTNLAACCLLGIPHSRDTAQPAGHTAMRLPGWLLKAMQKRCSHSANQLVEQRGRHTLKERVENNGVTRVVDIDMTTVTLPGSALPLHLLLLSAAEQHARAVMDTQRGNGHDLFTESPRMVDIRETVLRIAPTPASVLLQGESGTGKTLLARMIHEFSDRSAGPLVEVNCAAIPENLLESELFGHVKGAFTGAVSDRPGRLQAADGGTLFLDEVSELPLHLQPKLLKALEEKCFQMVGSNKDIHVNVRIVAASNRNLRELVDHGAFRADLYYRLAVFSLAVPALRERPDDLPALIRHLQRRLAARGYRDGIEFSAEALALLLNYPWPGNVRELSNAVEHATILAKDGLITPKCLPGDILDHHLQKNADVRSAPPPGREIAEALEAAKGNRLAAARMLGIDRTTLRRRMQRLGLS